MKEALEVYNYCTRSRKVEEPELTVVNSVVMSVTYPVILVENPLVELVEMGHLYKSSNRKIPG